MCVVGGGAGSGGAVNITTLPELIYVTISKQGPCDPNLPEWINASCCNHISIRLENIQVYCQEKFLLKISVFFYCLYLESCWEALTLLPQLNSLSPLFSIPPSNLLLCLLLCWNRKQSILYSGRFLNESPLSSLLFCLSTILTMQFWRPRLG